MDLEYKMEYKVGDRVIGTDKAFPNRIGAKGIFKGYNRRSRAWVRPRAWVLWDGGSLQYVELYEIAPDKCITAGNTYTTFNGGRWECIFVRNGKAWMSHHGGTAYVWDAETGEAISLGGGDYNIALPERRNGSVEYVNGKPDFDTWEEFE